MHVDQKTARECYVVSLRLMPTVTSTRRQVNQRMVAMNDLDPRVNDQIRIEPRDNVEDTMTPDLFKDGHPRSKL